MRKWISLLLAFVLLLNGMPVLKVHAEDQQERAVAALQYQDPDLQDAICRADHIMYWTMIDQIAGSTTLPTMLEMASDQIEESATEEKCATFLATILTMQQYEIAQQIQQQSNYDDLKSTGDYVMDALEITSNVMDTAEVLPIITPALETALAGVELVQDNLDQAKYYNMVISDYCDAAIVLQAIIENCQDPELKKAASVIASGREELLEKQLTYLENSLDNIAEFEWDFFADQLFFPLMKETDAYQDSQIFQLFVDAGEFCFDDLQSMQETVFSVVMLAGDIGFGTTNTFRRYQEMRILADISLALSQAIKQMQIPDQGTEEQTVAIAQQKCSLYKLLLTTHTRGEYLIYQLLTQDSGILSLLRRTYEQSHDGQPFTEATYTSQIEAIEGYYNTILRIEQMLRSQEQDFAELPLSQINAYYDGQLAGQYLFTYDDDLLTEVECSSPDGTTVKHTFQYDAENRLIYTEREDAFSTLCTSSYTYDENGKLNQWTEAEGGRITYQCEYDAHQRLSKAVGTTDGAVYTHSYTYNDDGQITQEAVVIQSNGENISYDVWYTYNESGKLSSTWGDYNGGTTQTTYSYDYAPFILAENSGLMSGYSLETLRSLCLCDRENHTIFSLDLGAVELVTDEYGKLTQAVSDYARFDFYYGSYTQESTQPASVPEATDGDAVLTWEDIPQNFVFTSGAGAWQTSLDLQPDGSFSGAYSDSNMGESSDANPHGTVYYCNFNGQFTQPQPVTEYCYSVELTEFSAEDSENAEYIDNGIRYVRSEPYGFNDSQCFYLYLPGTPVVDLPEDCLYWLNLLQQVESEIPSGMYVIYNQVETAVFVGSLE